MIMNARVRTRSRYSRLATMRTFLSMARHPRLDARGADTLEEDLMERRLHQLEPLDVRARVDQPTEQELRIGVRCELQLEEVVAVVDLAHELRVAKHVPGAVVRTAAKRQRHVAHAGVSLHRRDGSVEHLLAAGD